MDEAKVQFKHVPGVQEGDGLSESEGYSEGSLVYYYKDDVTEFSRGLKLNRLKKKSRGKGKKGTRSDNSMRSIRSASSSGSEGGFSSGSSWMSGRNARLRKAYSQDTLNVSHRVDDWNARYLRMK